MQCLVMDVTGKLAMFRKPFTTTSTSTYSFMHPCAVRGFIGAIMGVSREELHSYTQDLEVAIQVVNEVDKSTQSFNLVAVNSAGRFPVNTEFLRGIKYRLYISWENEKLEKLKNILIKRMYTFTPYLGCSECVAKVDYIGLFGCLELDEGSYNVGCVVPTDKATLDLSSANNLKLERIPVRSGSNREYSEYKKVYFTTGSNTLKIKTKECKKVGDECIVFI